MLCTSRLARNQAFVMYKTSNENLSPHSSRDSRPSRPKVSKWICFTNNRNEQRTANHTCHGWSDGRREADRPDTRPTGKQQGFAAIRQASAKHQTNQTTTITEMGGRNARQQQTHTHTNFLSPKNFRSFACENANVPPAIYKTDFVKYQGA